MSLEKSTNIAVRVRDFMELVFAGATRKNEFKLSKYILRWNQNGISYGSLGSVTY